MSPTTQILLTVLSSALASSGLWAYLNRKCMRSDAQTEMLIGLGHDRIISLGMKYIERGWITHDEYENLNKYLYTPYDKLGGNGSAKRIMKAVDRLEIRKSTIYNSTLILNKGEQK